MAYNHPACEANFTRKKEISLKQLLNRPICDEINTLTLPRAFSYSLFLLIAVNLIKASKHNCKLKSSTRFSFEKNTTKPPPLPFFACTCEDFCVNVLQQKRFASIRKKNGFLSFLL